MEKHYEQMKLSDFQKIKAGDKIYCQIDTRITEETATGDAFYNYDADEPGWEIETANGFFCWDSVYTTRQDDEQKALESIIDGCELLLDITDDHPNPRVYTIIHEIKATAEGILYPDE